MPKVTGAHSPSRSQDPVKIYEGVNRRGDSASFDRVGRFNISNSNTGVNDGSISSIEVTTGWMVEAMKAGKNPGDVSNRIFTGYTASMPSGWNDIIDEIVISRTSAPAPASRTGQSPAPASRTGQSPAPAPASTEEPMDISQYIWWGVGGFALCCCCCLIVLAMLISSKQKPRFGR